MNLHKSIFATVGAAAILATTALTSFAAPVTDTASVSIQTSGNGALTVSITADDFGTWDYSFDDRENVDGSMVVRASDTRGTAAGWKVNLSASDFSGNTGSFDISNLDLSAGNITAVEGNTDTSGHTKSGAAPVEENGVASTQIWSTTSGSGDGIYDLALGAQLDIPGGTRVGTYTSTVTVEITGNVPGGN
jgi:hypothetical protein